MTQLQKIVGLTATCLLVITPSIVSAQTTSTSIAALLEQIKALQAQIAALQGQQHALVVEQKATVQTLARTLKEGVSGDDVRMLQALLASDPSVYPEGTISGYYGKLTAAAVKRFQKKQGLEQLGNVGPKTLQKLKELSANHPLEVHEAQVGHNGATTTDRIVCHKVPPGHLVAPGWLKKNDGVKPLVPECQTLPSGIAKKLSGGTTTPPTVSDTTAPVVSALATSLIATTSATVSWMTNEAATGNVYFGTVNPVVTASSTAVSAGSLLIAQSVALSGLSASTTYYYVVTAKDAANNMGTSAQQSFTTTN